MPKAWIKPARRIGRWAGGIVLTAILLLAVAFGFGFSAGDVARMRAFAEGVGKWQVRPDFRKVQREYIELGAGAMQARLLGISAANVVMGFRSLPGLPSYLAVSPTSAAHYDAFGRGELSAYLHLSGEQGVTEAIGSIEQLGREKELTDERVREFLRGFKLPVPIATDDGAVASVRSLLRDIDARRGLVIRAKPQALYGPHIRAAVKSVGAPANPVWMNHVEQQMVYRSFDDQVRNEPELWRTKQVSDFLAGIWAQGYGQIYLTGITWALRLRMIGRVIVIFTICIFVLVMIARKKKAHARVCVGV